MESELGLLNGTIIIDFDADRFAAGLTARKRRGRVDPAKIFCRSTFFRSGVTAGYLKMANSKSNKNLTTEAQNE
jgi:hypothetical protein